MRRDHETKTSPLRDLSPRLHVVLPISVMIQEVIVRSIQYDPVSILFCL